MSPFPPSRDPAAPTAARPSGGNDAPATGWPGWLLGLIFVALTAGIALTGYTLLRHQQTADRRAAQEQLSAIAELKVDQIRRWYQENLKDAGHILDADLVAPVVREFLAAPSAAAPRARVQTWMSSLQRHYGYHRLVLLDPRLQPQLALPAGRVTVGAVAREKAAEALRTGRLVATDLHRSDGGGDVHMGLLVPLAQPGTTPFGVLLMEILPTTFLFPRIQSWPTPSASGETLLVRRDGDDVVYLNELRHTRNTALQLRAPLTRRDVPAVRAVLGEEAIFEGLDYRGVPVLSALRRIPDTPWFMVAKVDLSEINEPLRQQTRSVSVAMAALILAAGLGVGGLWRHQKVLFVRQELAQRRRAEEELRASEGRLRSLYAAMTEMVVVHEIIADAAGHAVDYRILDCNPAFERATGITRARALGALASGLYGAPTPPYLETYARVAATGQPEQFEVFFPPLGKYFDISAFSPQPGQFATVTTDITARKVAEEERASLGRELARKNEELEGMIYVASHDLRAPLVNVQGFSHRLEKACNELLTRGPDAAAVAADEVPVDQRIMKALRYIRSSAERMDGLISGLLRVSRLGRIAVNLQSVDMNGLLQQVVATMEFQLEQAGVEVQLDSLPPCTGDPQLLGQVFTNLLDNALKYRAPERPLRVTISGRTDGRELIYGVADTGLGIPKEHQGKIWEMFHRLHPAGPAAGEGLGLKIVRRILERQRGRVWVESEAGQGSCFYVALPLAVENTPTKP